MGSTRTGNPVANQFIMSFDEQVGAESYFVEIFQSYRTVIARAEYLADTKITLDPDWDYSRTTTRYLYKFLSEAGFPYCNKASVMRHIKEGTFKVERLNR